MRRALALAAVLAGCQPPGWTTPEQGLDRIVLSAWGASGRDLWFAGGGLGSGPGALAMHYDGERFTDMATGEQSTLWWVFGLSPTDVFFVGEHTTMLHWGGGQFAHLAMPNIDVTLYGIWGTSDGGMWAVGGIPNQSSVILHDGAVVQDAPSIGGAYFKVWGASRDCVYVVGEGGTILNYDGAKWTRMDSGLPPTETLLTVAGRACDDVYAVGLGSGVALHFDGTAWKPVAGLAAGGASGLAGVAVDGAGDVAIGGLGGAKFRFSDGAWADDSRVPPRTLDFHGAWLDADDDVWLVGGNFVAPAGAPRQGLIARYGR